jgi:branched-chain amino acid transport system substrate-binding protein
MKVMRPIIKVCLIFALIGTTHKSVAFSLQNEKDKSVKIGLLVSTNKSVSARQGAELAIQKANQDQVQTSISFKLVVKSMEGPWGTGSKQAVDLIFEDKVVALIGSHDGRNAHLVEQAATKARIVNISAWATDPTLSQAFVPWYFGVIPNDIQQATALINEIYIKRKINKIAVLSDNSYDSKQASTFFIRTAKLEGKNEPFIFIYDSLIHDFKDLLNRIGNSEVDAIILFGEPSSSALVYKQIREKKMNQPVFGSINLLGEIPESDLNITDFEGVTLPLCGLWFTAEGLAFQQEYKKKYGSEPDPAAAYSFDAVNLIIEAVKNGKTEYNDIQEWLLKVKYDGVTGLISFDEKGNRIFNNEMMMIKNGSPVKTEK